jgi:hypothetical protein
MMLRRVQRGLEELYRIGSTPEVDNFLIGDELREQLGITRRPREQLLLHEDGDELTVGLFIDDGALDNLATDDPTARLHDGNLQDFLLVVEGVSHFVYLTWRAQADLSVSALELELQAEIDKYVTCLLGCESLELSAPLRRRLFERFDFHEDLDDEELDRYKVANRAAHRYSVKLEKLAHERRIGELLRELRRFYRLPLGGKLELASAH